MCRRNAVLKAALAEKGTKEASTLALASAHTLFHKGRDSEKKRITLDPWASTRLPLPAAVAAPGDADPWSHWRPCAQSYDQLCVRQLHMKVTYRDMDDDGDTDDKHDIDITDVRVDEKT